MNLQELNILADEFDSNGLADQSIEAEGENKGGAIAKVKNIYGKVRPFLYAVGNLFFVPKKWRTAILTYIAVMDGLTIIEVPEVPEMPELPDAPKIL